MRHIKIKLREPIPFHELSRKERDPLQFLTIEDLVKQKYKLLDGKDFAVFDAHPSSGLCNISCP